MAQKTNVTKELSKLQQTIEDLRLQISKQPKQEQKLFPLKYTLISRLRIWLGFFADLSSLLIPAATVYLAFSNFITVPTTNSLQANDPLTIPFIIENNSYVNLRDMNIVIEMIKVVGESSAVKTMVFEDVGIKSDFLLLMKANSSHTILFKPDRLFAPKLTKISQADIQIHVVYKALFFPKSFTQTFRFVALPSQEGMYKYYPIQTKL